MNLFVLDSNPTVAPSYLYKVHVSKMPLETTQLLCDATRVLTGDAPYKAYNVNNPLVKWILADYRNYGWLWFYGISLFAEFQSRRGKMHKSFEAFSKLPKPPLNVDDVYDYSSYAIPFTLPPLVMPDEFQRPCGNIYDVVACYRDFYKNGKSHLANFENLTPPTWYEK